MDIEGTPLPLGAESPLDGTYGRLLDAPPQWWRCARCAEYRPSGGLWRMQLDRGVMRIFYEVNNWVSIASFRVEGDRFFIFNDLACRQEGEYRWKLDEGSLSLEVVEDPCAFGVRSINLSHTVWQLCPQDRNAEESPLGCADRASFEPLPAQDLPVTVTVYRGDVRRAGSRPPIVVGANAEDQPAPEGIEITYSPESVEYGIQRVLWWGGDWIEATTSLPFEGMGVQFYGTITMGWASVYFDGVEVWRGDVSSIWYHAGYAGGYIQVSGFEPGEHSLRVESVAGDYRPVTVSIFGFGEVVGKGTETPD